MGRLPFREPSYLVAPFHPRPLNARCVQQVVALCNELVGRVPGGVGQAISAQLRPISLSTPAGRFDWDPVGEVTPLFHSAMCSVDIFHFSQAFTVPRGALA